MRGFPSTAAPSPFSLIVPKVATIVNAQHFTSGFSWMRRVGGHNQRHCGGPHRSHSSMSEDVFRGFSQVRAAPVRLRPLRRPPHDSARRDIGSVPWHPLIGDADSVHSGTSGIRSIQASKDAARYVRLTSTPDIVSGPRHRPLSALCGPLPVRRGCLRNADRHRSHRQAYPPKSIGY
jgi:hypothetical protein